MLRPRARHKESGIRLAILDEVSKAGKERKRSEGIGNP